MTSAIKTRKVDGRRSLRFARMTDVLADVDALDEAPARRSLGNWSPAQNVDHVASVIDASLDGFPIEKMAWPLRLMGKLLRDRALTRPMSAGFKVPGGMSNMVPAPDLAWSKAVDHMRHTIGRIEAGTRMERPSPLLGPLGHEQWCQLHCRHAELHLSFIEVD